MVAEFALLLSILLMLYFGLTSIPIARRVRRLRRVRNIERTRSTWGEARQLLFQLVAEGKLDAGSATFRSLYWLQTYVMRNPEEYDEVSRTLVQALSAFSERDDIVTAWARHPMAAELAGEFESWPPEMQQVIGKMVEGATSLLTGHAGRSRFWIWLVRSAPQRLLQQRRRPAVVPQATPRRAPRWTPPPVYEETDYNLRTAVQRLEEIHAGEAIHASV